MTEYNLILANTIALVVALIAMIVLMLLWIRAEWKLAKYNESCFFRKKEQADKQSEGKRNAERRSNAG